jgi:repressor LexA
MLTTRQTEVLEEFCERIDRNEPAPTYRELCARFGWSSTGTARDHLKALAKKGLIELSGGLARGVRLVRDEIGVRRVPVVGKVIAGVPFAAEELLGEELIPIPANWISRGVHYALRVRGDSMSGAGIFPGDIVVVRQQAFADEGSIVVVIDGETTLKRLGRRGRSTILFAENRKYAPINVRTDSAEIQGVVVGLQRLFEK